MYIDFSVPHFVIVLTCPRSRTPICSNHCAAALTRADPPRLAGLAFSGMLMWQHWRQIAINLTTNEVFKMSLGESECATHISRIWPVFLPVTRSPSGWKTCTGVACVRIDHPSPAVDPGVEPERRPHDYGVVRNLVDFWTMSGGALPAPEILLR